MTLIPESKGLTSDTAIIVPSGHDISYSDLRASTLNFRDILRNYYGVKTGDVVGVSLINSLEFVIAFMGIARRAWSPLVTTSS